MRCWRDGSRGYCRAGDAFGGARAGNGGGKGGENDTSSMITFFFASPVADDRCRLGKALRRGEAHESFDAAAGGGATLGEETCGRNSMVECQPSKLNVDGSSPFARFGDRSG